MDGGEIKGRRRKPSKGAKIRAKLDQDLICTDNYLRKIKRAAYKVRIATQLKELDLIQITETFCGTPFLTRIFLPKDIKLFRKQIE